MEQFSRLFVGVDWLVFAGALSVIFSLGYLLNAIGRLEDRVRRLESDSLRRRQENMTSVMHSGFKGAR